MRMKKPPHPGRVVRQECIEPLGLTVTEAAKRLGVTRQALNNLVNGKGGVSAEMAVRLSKAFGSSPEVWLGMQMEYDLAQVEKGAHNIKVKRVARARGTAGRICTSEFKTICRARRSTSCRFAYKIRFGVSVIFADLRY
jgi:addiction module HigA family antidote